MFQYNMTTQKHFTSKSDSIESYKQFLASVGLSIRDFPFEWKGKDPLKDKPASLRATSWGGYVTADNEWRVFIAMREPKTGYTRMYSWGWDSEQRNLFGMRTNSWLP